MKKEDLQHLNSFSENPKIPNGIIPDEQYLTELQSKILNATITSQPAKKRFIIFSKNWVAIAASLILILSITLAIYFNKINPVKKVELTQNLSTKFEETFVKIDKLNSFEKSNKVVESLIEETADDLKVEIVSNKAKNSDEQTLLDELEEDGLISQEVVEELFEENTLLIP